MKNYYQTLNVPFDASYEVIKNSYRAFATKFHPDKHNDDPFFKERFQEIQEAFEILSDKQKREEYDKLFSNQNKVNFPEVSLFVNKSVIKSGEIIIFNWTSINTVKVAIVGHGNFKPNDTFSTTINKSTVFKFIFEGKTGIIEKTKEITVLEAKKTYPPKVNLEVDKLQVEKNDTVTFKWSTMNVNSVEIVGYGVINDKTEFKTTITTSKEFTFIFKGDGGTQTIKKIVSIIPNRPQNIKSPKPESSLSKFFGFLFVLTLYTLQVLYALLIGPFILFLLLIGIYLVGKIEISFSNVFIIILFILSAIISLVIYKRVKKDEWIEIIEKHK